MRGTLLQLAALVLLCPSASSAAQARADGYAAFTITNAQEEGRYSAAYRSCMDASGGVTSSMRDCSGAEYRRLDGVLNRTWRATMQRLAASMQTRLRGEQRAWLKTRDATCQAQLEAEGASGGTMDLLTLDSCALREMIRRTMWIERYR